MLLFRSATKTESSLVRLIDALKVYVREIYIEKITNYYGRWEGFLSDWITNNSLLHCFSHSLGFPDSRFAQVAFLNTPFHM